MPKTPSGHHKESTGLPTSLRRPGLRPVESPASPKRPAAIRQTLQAVRADRLPGFLEEIALRPEAEAATGLPILELLRPELARRGFGYQTRWATIRLEALRDGSLDSRGHSAEAARTSDDAAAAAAAQTLRSGELGDGWSW